MQKTTYLLVRFNGPITFATTVASDMGFGTLPRVDEFREYIPSNPFVGRAKDGQIVDYVCIGSGANFAEFQKAFSVEDVRDLLLYHVELRHLYLDAISVVEGRNISRISFYDCKGARLGSLLQTMDCEYCILSCFNFVLCIRCLLFIVFSIQHFIFLRFLLWVMKAIEHGYILDDLHVMESNC